MPEKKRITLYEIARLAGTSKSTVSRVINGSEKVSSEVRSRVEAVMRKYGYQPNFAARALSKGRKGLVGVISMGLEAGYYVKVLQGIDHEASRHGVRMLFSIARNPQEYIALLQTISGQGLVDGCILMAPPAEIYSCVPFSGSEKVVLCSSRPPNGKKGWDNVASVTVDNRKGFGELMDWLYSGGARNYVFVSGPENIYDCVQRKKIFEGYVKKKKDVSGKVLSGDLFASPGKEALREYLTKTEEIPDAVVCVNDSNATGALNVITECNVKKAKVIVTGCDGEDVASLLKIPTLCMPMVEIGKISVRKLLAFSEEPLHMVLPLELQYDY